MRLNEFTDEFEYVLFGDMKGDEESDTNIERETFVNIRNFISSPGPHSRSDVYVALERLKKYKDIYPDDLKPDARVAYRGTSIEKSKLRKLCNNYRHSYTYEDEAEYHQIPFKYKPQSMVQSWTTKIEVARKFMNENNGKIPIIVMARVDDDFILSSSLTNDITQTIFGYNEEYEIIRVSKKPIKATLLVEDEFIWL